MGSTASKHKSARQRAAQPKSPAANRNVKDKKRHKKLKVNGDTHSLASGDESRRSSVSFVPNGTVHTGDTKILQSTKPLPKAGHDPLAKRGSISDLNQVKSTVSPDQEKVHIPQNGTIPNKNHHVEGNVPNPDKENSITPTIHVSNVPEDATDVDVDTRNIPDYGSDYNGGGALPKSASTQNILSRFVKNGMGTNKKSSIQLIWEATKDESKKKLSQLCDVAFLASDHVAISRGDGAKGGLQLYSLQEGGKPGQVLGETFLKAPRGICPGNDGTVAVTDWEDKTVQFMDINGGFLGAWKTNKFQHPGGIVMNRDGRYIIADITRKEAAIGLYSPYGKLLRRFGTENFDWPWYVAVDRRNRILVSERKNATINVFDDVGRFLFKFGGTDSSGRSSKNDDVFSAPGGLAVDAQNNILVADTDNYRTSLFSPDGVFIKTLTTSTFSRPVSVAYDDGMIALVTDSDLRLYKTYMEKTSL